MTQASSTSTIPGYRAGTWQIDPVHSDVSFTVRHMMVSKVRGGFKTFSGVIITGAEPAQSSVTAEIDMTSISTNNDQRDEHIRSADFLEVEKYPTMSYRSSTILPYGGDWTVEGELTLHGVTRSVPLQLEVNGFGPDPYGGYRSGFSAKAEINRKDFGISIELPMDGGGVVVADKISISLEIEAVLQQD